MDEEGKTDVESAGVRPVLDVFLRDLRGNHAHKALQILHEFDGKPVLSRSVEY